MYCETTTNFHTQTLNMNFNSCDYNYYASGKNTMVSFVLSLKLYKIKKISNVTINIFQNDEYAHALQNRVELLYANSFVCKYYDYEPKAENGIVSIWNKQKKEYVDKDTRFKILINIPDNTKFYFQLMSWWNSNFVKIPTWINPKILSLRMHGFQTNNAPGTKSLFYKAPFILMFKTSANINSNFLLFNNHYKPNLEECILALLTYDEDHNQFNPTFSPGISLQTFNNLSLNTFLEFTLFDSKKNLVKISDNSQLFITLVIP